MLRKSFTYLQKRSFCSTSDNSAVLNTYLDRVNKGLIKDDPHQRLAIGMFDKLRVDLIKDHDEWLKHSVILKDYVNRKIEYEKNLKPATKQEPKQGGSFFGGLFSSPPQERVVESARPVKPISKIPKLQGLYLYGGPGCGKTYMMDMFYDQVPFKHKQRLHFNEFMLKVHDNLHKLDHRVHHNPLAIVAQNVASQIRLLCFDEFQVSDIGDALIMKNLFHSLFLNNVVLVATSNRPPEDLYYQGLQRHLFVPFIDILKKECKVFNMNSPTDYRLTFETEEALKATTYIEPNNHENNKKLDRIFKSISKEETGKPLTITVMSGREIQVPRAANGVAMFDFMEICDKAYGSMDFIAICRNFHTLILKNVPQITLGNRNLARRFILLVDELYNHKVKLYISSSEPLNNLFKISLEDGPSDEMFALDRCKSRLAEMQSKHYMDEPAYYHAKLTGGKVENVANA